MPFVIRPAIPDDATRWCELAVTVLGKDYPAKEVFTPDWIKAQLEPQDGHETWVADANGQLAASISILRPGDYPENPVANLGRNLYRPESFSDGSAEALLRKMVELAGERGQMAVVRVPVADNAQQILCENVDFACAGFQPLKHMLQARAGILFYIRAARPVLVTRLPLSESLPQTSELAVATLEKLSISNPITVRDGTTGYPLQCDVRVHEATFDDFELWRVQAEASNPPKEISGGYNLGCGLMRIDAPDSRRALLGQRDDQIVAGLAYCFDEQDRCLRVSDGFATDDLSMGGMLQHAVKLSQELSAVYAEIDVLATAPRLLKSAEQLGFVPVAYLPAFYCRNASFADVVKLVKLNVAYLLENVALTTQARGVAEIVDRNFEDQKVGVAIINLLRALPIFEGLGDGELRKIARLFTQKLFRPGDCIFKKGDSGNEAYIVMRGQVDIQLEGGGTPIASVTNGKIFGELAFLDGAPRNADAIASQPSILLVVQRTALNDLIHREPHLGMVVMRNVALDLSNKLRQANTMLGGKR